MAMRKTPYVRNAAPEARTRVVVMMPSAEAQAIDDWAVPAGMPDRTAAVRFLLKRGLAAMSGTPAAGVEA